MDSDHAMSSAEEHVDTFTVPEGVVALHYPAPPISWESMQVVEKWLYLEIQKMKRGVDWEKDPANIPAPPEEG